MQENTTDISLRISALIAGLAYLLMMSTSFAEFYVNPKIIVAGQTGETIKNITANEAVFRYGILAYLITFIGDILAAWALYNLLSPVNKKLSLLTAWFRLIYTLISLIALLNLTTVLRLVKAPASSIMANTDGLVAQVQFSLDQFRSQWSFGYIFFGIHLLLLGYLVFRSKYIPRIFGVLLVIAGIGWLADSLKPLLFPQFSINFLLILIAGLGEIVFMLWLLIRGHRIKQYQP